MFSYLISHNNHILIIYYQFTERNKSSTQPLQTPLVREVHEAYFKAWIEVERKQVLVKVWKWSEEMTMNRRRRRKWEREWADGGYTKISGRNGKDFWVLNHKYESNLCIIVGGPQAMF